MAPTLYIRLLSYESHQYIMYSVAVEHSNFNNNIIWFHDYFCVIIWSQTTETIQIYYTFAIQLLLTANVLKFWVCLTALYRLNGCWRWGTLAMSAMGAMSTVEHCWELYSSPMVYWCYCRSRVNFEIKISIGATILPELAWQQSTTLFKW